MMDWEKFFKEHEDYTVRAGYYKNSRTFSLEELYQAFKARLQQELMVDVPGTSHYGLLQDRHSGDARD